MSTFGFMRGMYINHSPQGSTRNRPSHISLMSVPKDRCRWVGVFRAPAHLSTEEFERGFADMAREIATVPAARDNMSWKEVSFANSHFNEEIIALGLPVADRVALLIGEAESYDEMRRVAKDPEVLRIITEARTNIGIGEGSMVFTADVLVTLGKSE
ncbi:hypothetical protein DFH07DRAFT_374178 [Mycena maculata]|uniref:Uncharacterized protein n=1 Tax=Mycena maculata TaxID=230809 RepID=A0AAD7H849_9AGAR|nr:hypothetical protein DFH07DRAFT_374178 [Mycena maculata]